MKILYNFCWMILINFLLEKNNQISKEEGNFKMWFGEAISSCMLNSSGSWSVHISSINVIFFDGLYCLVLRVASSLDAFRTYPSMRSCPACFITTGTPEAPEHRSSRTRCSFHSDNSAPSRYHTNCLAYILKTYVFVLCGLYLHPFN